MGHKKAPPASKSKWWAAPPDERFDDATAGCGEHGIARELTHWCGIDLVRAALGGQQLLAARDGRQVVLVDASQHHVPGDSIAAPGVTAGLRLSALLGVVDSFEVWLVAAPVRAPQWRST